MGRRPISSSGAKAGRTTGSAPVVGRVGRAGRLAVIFGDQLDERSAVLDELDPSGDVVLMVEAESESRHVPSHVQRTVLFLSAMRHFAERLRRRGYQVRYVRLDDPENTGSFSGEVARAIEDFMPREILCVWPGEWRVLEMVRGWPSLTGVPLRVLPDRHFLSTPEEFACWAQGKRGLVMEFFYREQRRRTGYLMHGDPPRPEGGEWNFDRKNRLSFGPKGPSPIPPEVVRFEVDEVTREVIAAVRRRLPDLPGRMESDESFGWPVNREQALEALGDFVRSRLASFGPYEDAMWSSSRFVYHSALSPSLNLKLLDPRECCEAAIGAYRRGEAPLQSVEAFVRQIIGWREFIRGVYWLEGPGYAERNGLDQHGRLPEFYWTGRTDMACVRSCLGQVLDTAYGHHIQRLMVTGNFALLAGVHPRAVSDWYLGMYADGVDWVTLPNALGMVMHADRRPGAARGVTGLVGTKPYAASGKYIQRMSDYCRGCRYDPSKRSGEGACPFTVFYWDFLLRNRERLSGNQRIGMMLRQAMAMPERERVQISIDAGLLRGRLGVEAPPGEGAGEIV